MMYIGSYRVTLNELAVIEQAVPDDGSRFMYNECRIQIKPMLLSVENIFTIMTLHFD